MRCPYCRSTLCGTHSLSLHAGCSIFLPDFNQIWSFSTNLRKAPQYQISQKPLQGSRADTCRHTDNTKQRAAFAICDKAPNRRSPDHGSGMGIQFYALNLTRHSKNHRTTGATLKRQQTTSTLPPTWISRNIHKLPIGHESKAPSLRP